MRPMSTKAPAPRCRAHATACAHAGACALAAFIAQATIPSRVAAQGGARSSAPAPSHVAAANAMLATEFTSVSAVRELADGRLLIVDAGERKLHLADLRTGEARVIGREGAGAREYASPRLLLPLPADTSLLPDPRNGRWLLLVRDSIVGLLGPDAPAVRMLGGTPMGADGLGRVLGSRPRIVAGVPRLDSLLLIRAYRTSARVDTLGTLLARSVTFAAQGRIDPTKPVPITINPLSVGEQAAMHPDGWIAIARLAPYRVEWIAPSGQRVRGAPLRFDVIPVDDREKLALLARESRQTGRPVRNAAELGDWPATMPPFLSNAMLPAPDGTVWVLRTPTRANPETRYDVVDRRGALVRQVVLREAERVVGFGRSSLYTVAADDDGIERLRRHPPLLPR